MGVLWNLSIPRPSCFSSLFRLLNDSREHSNHRSFSSGSTVMILSGFLMCLYVFLIFYVMPVLVR